MSYTFEHLALGILRQHDHIVLVQQPGLDHDHPVWVLPGGLVEAGELVTEALVREVQEEAGVDVQAIAHLAVIAQIDRPQAAMQTTVFVFEIDAWQGMLGSQDPDQEVMDVAFVSLIDALDKLQSGGWRGIREPILAYLRGEAPAGTIWMYREEVEGQNFVSCLPQSCSGPSNQHTNSCGAA